MITCHCKQHYGPALGLLINVPLWVDTHTRVGGAREGGRLCLSPQHNREPQTCWWFPDNISVWRCKVKALTHYSNSSSPLLAPSTALALRVSRSSALLWKQNTGAMLMDTDKPACCAPGVLVHVAWTVSEWSISGGRSRGHPQNDIGPGVASPASCYHCLEKQWQRAWPLAGSNEMLSLETSPICTFRCLNTCTHLIVTFFHLCPFCFSIKLSGRRMNLTLCRAWWDLITRDSKIVTNYNHKCQLQSMLPSAHLWLGF